MQIRVPKQDAVKAANTAIKYVHRRRQLEYQSEVLDAACAISFFGWCLWERTPAQAKRAVDRRTFRYSDYLFNDLLKAARHIRDGCAATSDTHVTLCGESEIDVYKTFVEPSDYYISVLLSADRNANDTVP